MKRTAFISIVGRPNVGKSTLLNALLGEKVAIVSSKPQTTRNRITGILTTGENFDDQYVFLDTPGMHKPKTKLGDYMVKTARDAIADTDAVILVVEAEPRVGTVEQGIIERLKQEELPSLLAINKIDRSTPAKIAETIQAYASLHNFDAVVPVSAAKNKNVNIVLEECEQFLEEGEHFFDDDIATDQPERQIAAEIVREKLLRLTDNEIPHGTAVIIDTFEEGDTLLSINATIVCEKQSHKGIIIGAGGEMLKKIGSYAREDMEKFFGLKVFLQLWVKVKENWRDSSYNLTNFGFTEE